MPSWRDRVNFAFFTIVNIMIMNYAGRIKLQSLSVVGEMSIIVNRRVVINIFFL